MGIINTSKHTSEEGNKMTKKELSVTTTVGTFTRNTDSEYVCVVVWKSPRAERDVALVRASGRKLRGVDARWANDNCYGVTWHTSKEVAKKTIKSGYKWDNQATLIGVFYI